MSWTRAESPLPIGRTPDRDVQAVGEGLDGPGLAILAEVAQDDHAVPGRPAIGDRIGILDGRGDPEPPPVVERQIHRLADLGLRGDQLDDEPLGEVKP